MDSSPSSVNDWLESQIHQQVAIWCEDPETNVEKIAGGVLEKSYLTYRILYKQIGRDLIAVRHRYSEFEGLRVDLRDRYHPLGILVPSLPPKNSVAALNAKLSSKVDDSPFVKERTLGLTLFCENIVASPWLRNDPQWKAFCRPSSGPITADESSTANQAETQLVGCLKQLELPYKFTMTQRMEDVREEVKNIEGHAKYLLERVRAVQQAERNLQAANEQLKRGFEGWFDAERIHIKSLGGRIFDEHDPVLKQHELTTSSIVALNSVITVRRNAEEDVPNYTGLTLAALMEYEIANVESLKELLKIHDEMVKEIDSYNNKINKLESSRNAKMEQIQDAKRILDDKQSCLNAFYKGFIYFTIPFIARQRASYIRRFFSGQICSTMSNSYTVFKACQEFFKQLMLPAQQVAEETSRMLELLNVRPIAKLPYEDLEGQFLNENNSSNSPTSGGKSPTQLKSSNLFLSYESDGLNGLFERALSISQKKPLVKNTPAGTAALTTHLFTSSVASTPMSNPNATNTASTATNNTTTAETPVAPATPANPLARRGSAVVRTAEKESLPRFVESSDDVTPTSNHAGSSAFMSSVDEEEFDSTSKNAVKPKQPELNEKSKNILSSLLGEPVPRERSVSPVNTNNSRASAPKGKNIWDDA